MSKRARGERVRWTYTFGFTWSSAQGVNIDVWREGRDQTKPWRTMIGVGEGPSFTCRYQAKRWVECQLAKVPR